MLLRGGVSGGQPSRLSSQWRASPRAGASPARADGAPPDAVDDTAAVVTGHTQWLWVLTNDTDPDGDTLTVSGATQPTGGGTIDCSYQHMCNYTAPATAGTETFTYTVSDGHGEIDTATVTITVTDNRGTDGPRRHVRGRRGAHPDPHRPGERQRSRRR